MTTQNEPKVIVTDVQKIETRGYGNAGKVALIGAFPTSTVQINSYTGLKEAQNDLIGEYTPSTIPEGCVSYGCLPYIFNSNKQSNYKIGKGCQHITEKNIWMTNMYI